MRAGLTSDLDIRDFDLRIRRDREMEIGAYLLIIIVEKVIREILYA